MNSFVLFPQASRDRKHTEYGKRQTPDSSWEFLNNRNDQLKTAENNFYAFMSRNNEQETTRNGESYNHMVQVRVCRLT